MPKGFVLWLTGLSGSGKTTLSEQVAEYLELNGQTVELLDGDVVRTQLSKGLGFGKEDRDQNVRRVGWVAARVARAGGAVICALISPYRDARRDARDLAAAAGVPFLEVHVATPLATCIERDPKGLYAKALAGENPGFTGIDDPYEAPTYPDLRIGEHGETVSESVAAIVSLLRARGLVKL
jgi:adenylyl-sulfate kinase